MSSQDWGVVALDLMLIALAIVLDPLPIMAFVLVVSSARGAWKGLVFILAWLACLVVVIAIVLGVTGGEPPAPRSPPGLAGLVAKLAIGIALVSYGLRRRHRVRTAADQSSAPAGGPGPPSPPLGDTASEMTATMDNSSVWAAAGLAVVLQPWGMVAAGAVTVLEADTSHLSSTLALFGFCLLASAGLIGAELYIVLAPQSAQVRLLRLRGWLEGHKEQAIVVICLVLGLWLTAKSIYQLTG
ncbi:GAP family protein [Streptomyces sp. NPDC048551]|uniref:GAP family protein n=1 Tax=Streptomyces sp. NPDC048551 TaxID=3155758 RepID=UPI0034237D2D